MPIMVSGGSHKVSVAEEFKGHSILTVEVQILDNGTANVSVVHSVPDAPIEKDLVGTALVTEGTFKEWIQCNLPVAVRHIVTGAVVDAFRHRPTPTKATP